MSRILSGLFVLIFTSPIDFPLMIIGGERTPHWPTEYDFGAISPGSWYHKAKGVWSVLWRMDAEYWQKLCRFIVWWETFFLILTGVLK